MSQILDKSELGRSIRAAREARGWSGAQLAEASGVSRAMIDRIERGNSSPTAVLLGRLAGALEISLSRLLTPVAGPDAGVARAVERSEWTDPATGYRRRQVVAAPAFPVDVTEVTLPAGERVAYPAAAFAFTRHLVWVLEGTLSFREGEHVTRLSAGDRLVLGEPRDCEYANETDSDCRYCVVVAAS